ncbi:septum site-determining protein MinC [Salipaludibacillus agaradhaerens]|uniref:Probable septum site-determining protein MinC n=1 Tax=Salipaludibacillus agaradhaerens TaxID=76935 RepID=A0A9Q4B0A8_SALAG|nr:septum site-determining protein MinC [Salipaludibacillus agaradhaerens]MCR6095667.1 septum site-determining protein MinC [Salipaludibacillus agaradhaerens]MCR6114773.1 septum site-determining protein MinC [Salipaludibacillus agaradhaerens]
MKTNQKKNQYVIIKGTKDGLTFILDDQCSMDTLKSALKETLSDRPQPSKESQGAVKAKLAIGKRYLENVELQELASLFSEEMNIKVEDIESDVISKTEAEHLVKEKQMTQVARIIRSGQVIELQGDLLIIGDVNPGATVKATGNIYILGKLKGIAHAGSNGNKEAVICASVMTPSQLRIASVVRRSPEESDQLIEQQMMECAYLNENEEIILEKLHKLSKIRPQLATELC